MPTIKQRKVAAKLLENNGNISKSMRQAGYSNNSAKNPKLLTESKGWRELMEKILPDDLLLKVHREGLAATKVTNSPTEPDREVADFSTRHKYLETAYKIRGYAKEDNIPPQLNQFNFFDAKLPDLQKRLGEIISRGESRSGGDPERDDPADSKE